MEGAVLIAQREVTEWQQGMAIHASAVAAITAAVTAAAPWEAAAAEERHKAEAAARKVVAPR